MLGGHHSCALDTSGIVQCWGIDDGSELDSDQIHPPLQDLFCTNSDDLDCDGIPTADDCDDADVNSTVIAEDADCDGVLTIDDCDDSNPNECRSRM